MSRTRTTPLRVGKKGAETIVQVLGPQNLRQHSEIETGSHALTAQARSVRDRLERKHVDHWTRIELAPRACHVHARSSVPTAVPRKREALVAAEEEVVVSWSTRLHLYRGRWSTEPHVDPHTTSSRACPTPRAR